MKEIELLCGVKAEYVCILSAEGATSNDGVKARSLVAGLIRFVSSGELRIRNNQRGCRHSMGLVEKEGLNSKVVT